MCGIWGFVATRNSHFDVTKLQKTLEHFFLLSQSRGKEAAGLALVDQSTITIIKRAVSASRLIKTREYESLLKDFCNKYRSESRGTIIAIGHARMVTNGSAASHDNNQPVIRDGFVCLHNGIIVNDEQLWAAHADLQRKYEVDTEVFLALVANYRQKGHSLVDSLVEAYREIQGANTTALFSNETDSLILATTNGSLYYSLSPSRDELIFASERYFIDTVSKLESIKEAFSGGTITQVLPGSGYIIGFDQLTPRYFTLDRDRQSADNTVTSHKRTIIDLGIRANNLDTISAPHIADTRHCEPQWLSATDIDAIKTLKRCSRCLLPKTFPLIRYDRDGVCNYCHAYRKLTFTGEDSLKTIAHQRRSNNGQPDCIVALSGGRDSCYGIHYVKEELKMNPIAYTYDWGMVTDLARRNISRMCGKLGIEHILVSADITRKRRYIRQNVLAWLKKPDLGTVPLFMAGDKQYFYYANKIMKQYGISTLIMSENRLERTHFKHGFCGITHSDSHISAYDFKITDIIKLASYYARQYIRNPAYINSSLIDTVGGFASFYVIPHNYIYLYNHIFWDENKIESTLTSDYGWELAKDTKSTWRIGDGTAPFYNFIYYTVAGFSEFDTFRSNQIREGLISRAQALDTIFHENQPRWESIRWYCDILGIDFRHAINTINAIPKLYRCN